MIITTNYEIGDKVVFSYNDTFVVGIIDQIRPTVYRNKNITFEYRIIYNSSFHSRSEEQLFKNCDELIKKLGL